MIRLGICNELFEGWELLHYAENERTEILAEKP